MERVLRSHPVQDKKASEENNLPAGGEKTNSSTSLPIQRIRDNKENENHDNDCCHCSPSQKRAARVQEIADNSMVVQKAAQLQKAINSSPKMVAQRKRQEDLFQKQGNGTESTSSLPSNLQQGLENMSGYNMSEVRVHYNSSKPAQLKAHAYAQDNDIYLAPMQEQHLPHEAWHVVQQRQGRVGQTMQMKGIAVNDDKGLEQEADEMGRQALQGGTGKNDIGLMNTNHEDNVTQRKCEKCEEEEKEQEGQAIQKKSNVGIIQRYPCQETDHETSAEHFAIEKEYVNRVEAGMREYEIPEGSVDTNERGTHKTGYADIVNRGTKEIFDIKRDGEPYPTAQLNQYLEGANKHCGKGWSKGTSYGDIKTIPFNDSQNIKAFQNVEGVISYFKVPKGIRSVSEFMSPAKSMGVGTSSNKNEETATGMEIATSSMYEESEKEEEQVSEDESSSASDTEFSMDIAKERNEAENYLKLARYANWKGAASDYRTAVTCTEIAHKLIAKIEAALDSAPEEIAERASAPLSFLKLCTENATATSKNTVVIPEYITQLCVALGVD